MVKNFLPSYHSPTIVTIAQALQHYLIEQHSLLQDIRDLLTNQRPECTLVDVCQLILQNMDSEASLIWAHREFFESHRLLYQEQATTATFGPIQQISEFLQQNSQPALGYPTLLRLQLQLRQCTPPKQLQGHLQQQRLPFLFNQFLQGQPGQLDQRRELESPWQGQQLCQLKQKRQVLDQLELNHENLQLPSSSTSPQNLDLVNKQFCAHPLSLNNTIINID